MPTAFPRSQHRLQQTSAHSWWLPAVVVTLLVAWLLWAVLARVTIYAVSDTARLEVEEAACPVEVSVEGRLATNHIVLGADVAVGDLLIELDAEPFRLERDELLATRAGHLAELTPLQAQIAALQRQLDDLEQAAAKGDQEQAAEVAEAEAALALASSVVERSNALHVEGLLSGAEQARVQFDFEKHHAAVGRQRAAKERMDWDRHAEASEQRAKLAECRHREVVVRSEGVVADAAIARLDHEIERRSIRAPVAGRLGETTNLRLGQFVAQGARVATIVPVGGIKIVAAFRPEQALGRIRTGQPARLRLHGFPWTQYGFVPARVASLASEALAGTVRVESRIDGAFPVTLQHGWPGTLEIEVERVSPATLVLRAAGALLAGSGPAAVATDGVAEGR